MATAATKEREQSVRLTEEMRGEIVSALLRNALAKREEAHEAASHKLALRIYNARYTPAQRKQMDAIPAGWLATENGIEVNLGGERHHFYFGPQPKGASRPEKRIPHKDSTFNEKRFPVEKRSELGAAITAHVEAGVALKAERAELKAKAQGILSSVTTTARLAEVWPEVKPFLPKFEARLLPVIRRDELNVAFGLKSQVAA